MRDGRHDEVGRPPEERPTGGYFGLQQNQSLAKPPQPRSGVFTGSLTLVGGRWNAAERGDPRSGETPYDFVFFGRFDPEGAGEENASGVFFEVSLALVGVASPAYFQS